MDDQRTNRESGGSIARASIRLLRLIFLMYAGAFVGFYVYSLTVQLSNDLTVRSEMGFLGVILGALSGLTFEWWLRSDGWRSMRTSLRGLLVAITIAALGLGAIVYICRK
jgi:hypothetical protein